MPLTQSEKDSRKRKLRGAVQAPVEVSAKAVYALQKRGLVPPDIFILSTREKKARVASAVETLLVEVLGEEVTDNA